MYVANFPGAIVLWRYCMLHPEIRDICDAAFALTGKRWAWWLAFVGLVRQRSSETFVPMESHRSYLRRR